MELVTVTMIVFAFFWGMLVLLRRPMIAFFNNAPIVFMLSFCFLPPLWFVITVIHYWTWKND